MRYHHPEISDVAKRRLIIYVGLLIYIPFNVADRGNSEEFITDHEMN